MFAALNSETINLAECDRDLVRKTGAAAAAEMPVEAAEPEQTEAEEQWEHEAAAGGPAGRVTSQVCRPGTSEVHPETGADDARLD